MTATAKQFVAAAAEYIGYREGQDANGNWNNDNIFGVWYGMNREPWCAMLDSFVANKVGALGTIVPKFASCWHGLKWFRDRNLTGHWPPQTGDIFFMCEYNPGSTYDTGNGWATIHTGIVEKYLGDGKVQTIEGNTNLSGSAQGNGVYRLVRQDSESGKQFIYARPQWAPEPVAPAPTTKPVSTTPKPAEVIWGSIYTGPRTVVVSQVRPNARNTSVRNFNALLWAWLCKNNPAYAKANLSLWKNESAYLYGLQAQRATQEMYRIMAGRDATKFTKVTLPTWPGWNGVRAVGGTPV